jgi:hypothetical protein
MTGQATGLPTPDLQPAPGPTSKLASSSSGRAGPLSYAAAVSYSSAADSSLDLPAPSDVSSASSDDTETTEPSAAATLGSAATTASSTSAPPFSSVHDERPPTAPSAAHERSRSSSRPRQDDCRSPADASRPHRPTHAPPTTAHRMFVGGEEGDGDVPLPLNKYTLFETRSCVSKGRCGLWRCSGV